MIFHIEDIGHVLFGLAYFDDAERERTPKMLWDVEWDSIKTNIQAWLLEYTNKGSS